MSEPEVPAFGDDFLEWLREASEDHWADLDDGPPPGPGTRWRRGTHWGEGLSEAEIDAAERRHGLCFPADYRHFLRVLHTTTPACRFFGYRGNKMVEGSRPGFWDWRRDDARIRDAIDDVRDGLAFHVEKSALWVEKWGPRPDSEAARLARLTELLAAAPRLVPVMGHRFLLPVAPYAVISVMGSDIIMYGKDLRDYLLAELGFLGRDEPKYVDFSAVPFWGDLIELNQGLARRNSQPPP